MISWQSVSIKEKHTVLTKAADMDSIYFHCFICVSSDLAYPSSILKVHQIDGLQLLPMHVPHVELLVIPMLDYW